MDPKFILCLSIFFIGLATWLLFSPVVLPSFSSTTYLQGKRILLLTAHPDDESMFFGPTLLALTRPELGNHVKILCLSAGEGDGDGAIRTKEVALAGTILGLRSKEDVLVLGSGDEDPATRHTEERGTQSGPYVFRDGLNITWPAQEISKVLTKGFAQGLLPPVEKCAETKKSQPKRQSSQQPSIDIVLTFDRDGVSGHSNHASCFYGAREFVSRLSRDAALSNSLELYTLTSTTILRKYISFFDIPISLLSGVLSSLFDTLYKRPDSSLSSWAGATSKSNEARGSGNGDLKLARGEASGQQALGIEREGERGAPRTNSANGPKRFVFISDFWRYRTTQRAMVEGHKSQMRWFRWGWIGIGRYMIVNDLKREKSHP